MKTANLTDALLDYWVAEGLGLRPTLGPLPGMGTICRAHLLARGEYGPFLPSADWAHGGPIIDRESISVGKRVDMLPGPRQWAAFLDVTFQARDAQHACHSWGASPLVAAMRAFVASKFGDEVPDDPALP